MPAADLKPAVERFLAHLRVERRLSPRTLAAYREDLERFADWLAGARDVAAWRDVGAEDVRGFSASEHRNGLSGRSIQRRLSALRSFFKHALKRGELGSNPALGVRAPKVARKLPNVLDADEMAAFLEIPADAALAARDRAMLELFYSSALRLAELCGLRWADVDLDDGVVRVLGKGAKTRVVPVGRLARAALAAWRAERAPSRSADFVFPGRAGAISPRAVQSRLKVLAQRQGIWKRVHPHLMRHSCASHVLESSGDLRAVQELLGHADIATTQIYTHLDFQHLARVYDAAHPRAKRRR